MQDRTLIIHPGQHKTGTSSIQDYLYHRFSHPGYHYMEFGRPNSSLTIRTAFKSNFADMPNYRSQKLPEKKIEKMRLSARREIAHRVASIDSDVTLLSAEAIALLNVHELGDFRTFFSRYYSSQRVLVYTRSPESLAASEFQQCLKTRYVSIEENTPFNLKRSLGKFDEVFGKENVTIRHYSPDALADGDVVRDFMNQLDLPAENLPSEQSNTGLSLEAVQLLYIYRMHFPTAIPGDERLVAQLREISGSRFRLHPELLARKVVDRHDSISWLGQRAGISFRETDSNSAQAQNRFAVRKEEDLLSLLPEAMAWLKASTCTAFKNSGERPDFSRPDGVAAALRQIAR